MNRPFKSPAVSTALHGSPHSGNAGVDRDAVPANKQPCLSCDGEGEVEIMGLDETRYHWELCDDCGGTGIAADPYCETCEGKLTVDGFCYACDDWGASMNLVAPLPSGWNRLEL